MCIIETPNRLWYSDEHTSLLPFFNWLPDNLAFNYSRFSPRANFNNLYRDSTDEANMDFLRRGRGISYHEFELTMKPIEQLNIVSSMQLHYRKINIFRRITWIVSFARRYEQLLKHINPSVHAGFYQSSLNLIIRKD